jgi:hypothetical protein
LLKGTVAAIANCVEVPSSLGEAIPGVKEKFAIAPVPPVFPQAPQVSQLGESSTLLRTVVFVGVPDGVGEGEAEGFGLGVGEAPATGDPAAFEPVVVPQPVIRNSNAIVANNGKKYRQVRTMPPLCLSAVEGRRRTVLRELSI